MKKQGSFDMIDPEESKENDINQVVAMIHGVIFNGKNLDYDQRTHLKFLLQNSRLREGLVHVLTEVGTNVR